MTLPPELLEQLVDVLAEKLAPRIAAELGASDFAAARKLEPEPWRLLDVDEASGRLGRSERWLRERTKRGEIPHVRLDNGALAYRLEDLQTFARARLVPGEGEVELEPRQRLRAVDRGWLER